MDTLDRRQTGLDSITDIMDTLDEWTLWTGDRQVWTTWTNYWQDNQETLIMGGWSIVILAACLGGGGIDKLSIIQRLI